MPVDCYASVAIALVPLDLLLQAQGRTPVALADDARGFCVGERVAKREDQIRRMRPGEVVRKRGGGRRHANE